MSGVPHIFDARTRRQRRQRAAGAFETFIAGAVAKEIGERIAATPGTFARALWCGPVGPPSALSGPDWIRGDAVAAFVSAGGVVFEEEHLPFGRRTLDLYVCVLTLHAINDLPGALAQIRASLKPGGLFMAGLFGGQTLHELRGALGEAEIEIDGGLSPRVAPFVDVRDAGTLLQRAGFVQPVADVDALVVRYEQPLKLLADLRAMGETNVLSERRRVGLKRSVLARALELYRRRHAGEDGRVSATFEILYLTGRAPA
jgi:SAM-dependent methyltransferase